MPEPKPEPVTVENQTNHPVPVTAVAPVPVTAAAPLPVTVQNAPIPVSPVGGPFPVVVHNHFEYQVIQVPNQGNPGANAQLAKVLSQQGEQGWEFVDFVASDTANTTAALLKRVK